ncbi:MAG: aminotransferase class I/II-fold pyridoxal phosphate-dependent enzyme, partial [Chloroflexota bacterium]
GPWVINVGSMSKVFWGGLRLGWVRASEQTIAQLASFKALADLGSPVLEQLIAARLMDHQPDVMRHWQRQIAVRLDCLTSALSDKLPDWTWERPRGGLSLWVRIPGNGREFAETALRHGVAIVAGPAFSADESFADFIRLSFVLDPGRVEEAVTRLARAWRAHLQSPIHPRAAMAIV